MNMTEYVAEKNVTVEVVDGPSHEVLNGWPHLLFKMRLKANGEQMTTEWLQGMGHGDAAPTADEVLNAVVTDAATYEEANDFEDFLHTFGLLEISDPSDKRKFEKVYNACGRQASRARRVFGDDEFDTLLNEIERL